MTASATADQPAARDAHEAVGLRPREMPAPRLPASVVPSITGVRLSPGAAPARLVNISWSGALVECERRLAPGTEVMVHFIGSFQPAQVPSRVARINVCGIGPTGALTYQIGLAFATPVTVPELPARRRGHVPATWPTHAASGSQADSILRNRW